MLAGKCIGHKSGVKIELVQKVRSGISIWSEDDPYHGPDAVVEIEKVGEGSDVALVLSIAKNALTKAKEYILSNQPGIGRIIHVIPAAALASDPLSMVHMPLLWLIRYQMP